MRYFNSRFKLITVAFSIVIALSSNSVMAETGSSSMKLKVEQDPVVQKVKANEDPIKNEIPTKMEPGAIITYNLNLEPTITSFVSKPDESSASPQSIKDSQKLNNQEFVDKEGRAAEDAFFASAKESVKDLPVVDIGYSLLPTPVPGMKVMYGSDGLINRIWVEEGATTDNDSSTIQSTTSSTIPTTTVAYPGRLSTGSYDYGTSQNVTITTSSVTGQGRFTVFRNGVGGSGDTGSSGKVLATGDIATKRQIDNPTHNTAITARALDTDVVKTVYKNDIGSLPDAVMDIYFWDWTNSYFGYNYSDTLSLPGRYFYAF
jgi:hypothetical protein